MRTCLPPTTLALALAFLPPGAHAANPVYANQVLADHPVLYYGFDETSGTQATDSSGAGKDGTYMGTIGFEFESFHPNLGTAIDLDGSSGFIDVPALGTYRQSSVEVWINIDGLAGGCCTSIYSTDTWASGNLHFNLKTARDVEHAINGGGPNNNNSPAGVIENGIWYHVVVTYDTTAAGETKFYIDGVEVTTSAHTARTSATLIAAQVGAWNGGRLLDARIDEFAIYDSILTPERVEAHYQAATAAAGDPLGFRVRASGPDLVFSWESKDGMLYNLRSETDPSATDPPEWPILDGHENLEATPPENTLTIPRPSDSRRFFVIEQFPAPPVSIFSDDFESGQGGWAFGSDGAAGTAWELGVPTNGPGSANSLVNCFGTNLASDYGINADVWLRSPAIDLTTAGGATLNYFQYRDIEEGFDFGIISVLDAADDSLIAEIPGIDSGAFAWELVSKSIPAEALGKMIKIEFRMTSDAIETFPGLFIDDFEVTVP